MVHFCEDSHSEHPFKHVLQDKDKEFILKILLHLKQILLKEQKLHLELQSEHPLPGSKYFPFSHDLRQKKNLLLLLLQ